jgi:hypothetical protein
MTPFEIALEAELNTEVRRFHDQWLFRWYDMTYEGGLTEVEDFKGGVIRYGGVTFGYQQQGVYWQAIDLYLRQKVHAVFKQWDIETRSYALATRRASVDGAARILGLFVADVLVRSLETDKRLRGDGMPYVPPAGHAQGGSGADMVRLLEAHRALVDQEIEEQKRKASGLWKWIETFYAENKGLIWFGGALIAVVSAAVHFFVR